MKNEKTNANENSTFDFALNFKVSAKVKLVESFWLFARWLGL